MVHDYQVTNGVPEELYNLAQLAEVATVRLRTTGVTEPQTGTDTIKSVNFESNGCRKIDNTAAVGDNAYHKLGDASKFYHTSSHTFKHEPTSCGDKVDMEKPDKFLSCAKKKWKNEWVKNCGSQIEMQDEQEQKQSRFPLYPSVLYSTLTSSTAMNGIGTIQQSSNFGIIEDESSSNIISRRNSIVSTSPPVTASISSLSPPVSSDEDSCYSYSHKIFDRKKSRRDLIKHNSTTNFVSVSNQSSPIIDGSMSDLERKSSTSTSGYISDASGSLLPGEDVHTCPDCGKRYSTSSNLARHRQTHRSLHDQKARQCPQCNKVYVSMPAFSMHVRTHTQGCLCKFCGKSFSRPWLLQGHIRTHTGEKPFRCENCGKSFADKSNLRAHVQTHSNVKPYECPRCHKRFALKSYLYKHEESSCMRNSLKHEKTPKAGRHQALKAKLLKRKNGEKAKEQESTQVSPMVVDPCPELMTSNSSVTKSVKTRIREVLELKHLPLMDNRISVIRATTEAISEQDYYNSQEPINYVINKQPRGFDHSVKV